MYEKFGSILLWRDIAIAHQIVTTLTIVRIAFLSNSLQSIFRSIFLILLPHISAPLLITSTVQNELTHVLITHKHFSWTEAQQKICSGIISQKMSVSRSPEKRTIDINCNVCARAQFRILKDLLLCTARIILCPLREQSTKHRRSSRMEGVKKNRWWKLSKRVSA